MASTPIVQRPRVKADIAGLDMGVSAVVMTYGVGQFARAEAVLNPGSAAETVDFEAVLKELDKANGVEGVDGTIMISNEDTISLSGFVAPPRFTAGRGTAPGYALGIIHETARISALNMGVYALESSMFKSNVPGKLHGYIDELYNQKDFKSLAQFMVKALVDGFEMLAPDNNTQKLKELIKKNNEAPLKLLEEFLSTIEMGDSDWVAKLTEYLQSMWTFFESVYKREADSFVTNLATLCDQSGIIWYSNPDVGLAGKSVGFMAEEAEGEGKKLTYAPISVTRVPASYRTPTGLAPTNTIVRVRAVAGFFDNGIKGANPILGMYPEGLAEGAVLNKSATPMWLPAASGYEISKLPGDAPLSIGNVSAACADKKRTLDAKAQTIQDVCSDWARMEHIKQTSMRNSVIGQFPLMLDVKAGEVYRYGKGKQSIGGMVWKVTHSISAEGRNASTTLEFRM